VVLQEDLRAAKRELELQMDQQAKKKSNDVTRLFGVSNSARKS
jgi:hypothetical protein